MTRLRNDEYKIQGLFFPINAAFRIYDILFYGLLKYGNVGQVREMKMSK